MNYPSKDGAGNDGFIAFLVDVNTLKTYNYAL